MGLVLIFISVIVIPLLSIWIYTAYDEEKHISMLVAIICLFLYVTGATIGIVFDAIAKPTVTTKIVETNYLPEVSNIVLTEVTKVKIITTTYPGYSGFHSGSVKYIIEKIEK